MGDFSKIQGLDELIAEGEAATTAISEQFEQGFITEGERYRLTVETGLKSTAGFRNSQPKQMDD